MYENMFEIIDGVPNYREGSAPNYEEGKAPFLQLAICSLLTQKTEYLWMSSRHKFSITLLQRYYIYARDYDLIFQLQQHG